jgi:RES domain-containing protein
LDRSVAAAVAAAPRSTVTGLFQRHSSPQYRRLKGSSGGGRWGPPGSYPVIYLGRPLESVIAEAYRLLVDPVEGMTGDLVGPRLLLTCEVSVSDVLDLRDPVTLGATGLAPSDLTDRNHEACQRVGTAAHQLGLAGVLVPAATELGETLALFERNLSPGELPVLRSEEIWPRLPPDPRETDLPVEALVRRGIGPRKDIGE